MGNFYKNKRVSSEGSGYTPRIQNAIEDAMNYAATPDAVMNGDPAQVQQDYPNGNFYGNVDRPKYFDRLEQNLRKLGDSQGVKKVQKERDEYQKTQGDLQAQKQKAADNRLSFFGPLAQKALTIYNEQGPDAANQYYQTAQQIALDGGMMNQQEYEDTFDPEKAQVVADYYNRAYSSKNGDNLPYKRGQLVTRYRKGKKYQAAYGGRDEQGNDTWTNEEPIPEKGAGGSSAKITVQKLIAPFKNNISSDVDPETGTSMMTFVLNKAMKDLENGADELQTQNNISEYIDEYNTNMQAALNAKKANKPGVFAQIKSYLSGSTASAGTGLSPAQEKAFKVLRSNPKNKKFSDDQLKSAVKSRVK